MKRRPEDSAKDALEAFTTGSNIPTTIELIMSHDGFDIANPSQVQMAICLAIDGLSLDGIWEDPEVRATFGGVRPPEVKPHMVLLVAASRALKTKMVSAACVRNVLTCDTSRIATGDEIRMSILGPDIDKAKPALTNMLALVQKRFPERLAKDPLKQSMRIVRDVEKGISIEVTLAALTRGGGGLVSRWCAGAHFSEGPRMIGEEDGARNLDESLTALQNRMLPGAQIIIEGSPFAPFGPVFDMDREHFGKPTADLLVMRAPGPRLWPERYTPEFCERIKARDERAYRADVLGEYVDPENSLIATVDIEKCIERGTTKRDPIPGVGYVAAIDPATRGATWTLTVLGTIGESERGELFEQAVCTGWKGTPDKPLKPWDVLTECRDICSPYGVDSAITDQASFDALADIAERVGFGLVGLFGSDGSPELDCEHTKTVIAEHRIALLDHGQQRTDLQRVTRRVTSNGSSYQLPTSGDSHHCDHVPPLGKAIRYAAPPPKRPERHHHQPPRVSAARSLVARLK